MCLHCAASTQPDHEQHPRFPSPPAPHAAGRRERRGVWLTDSTGKQYLDASGGAAVSCLGHGHPDVLAAMHAQIDRLAYAHTSFFTTEVAEELGAAPDRARARGA